MTFFKIIALLLVLVVNFSLADGGGAGGSEYAHLPNDFDLAVDAIETEDYPAAIIQLQSLELSLPNDANVLNLLGFSHRKSDDFEIAEQYYLKALEIDPKHKGANHYIGELYLQTDRLEKAEERLKVLKKASFLPNKQYRNLKKAIRKYKKQS